VHSSSVLGLTVAVVIATVMAAPADGIRLTATEGAVFDDFNGPAGSPPDSALWGYDYCALCR
jgi:hypothetical protein